MKAYIEAEKVIPCMSSEVGQTSENNDDNPVQINTIHQHEYEPIPYAKIEQLATKFHSHRSVDGFDKGFINNIER